MTDYSCSVERVISDLAGHQMSILREEGVYRHIRFKNPETGNYWFDLITWPGKLCIDGDMGTYVFSRLFDMFEFFRADRDYGNAKGEPLWINPGYWGEKLNAVDRHGFQEIDGEIVERLVRERFDQWVEEESPSEEDKEVLWDDIEYKVLGTIEGSGPDRAIEAAMNYRNEDFGFEFHDFWDNNFKSFTFHYLWCCYAIAWGIKHYDDAKASGGTQ